MKDKCQNNMPVKKGRTRRGSSPGPCDCKNNRRFECGDGAFICVPIGRIDFLKCFKAGNQISYTMCNNQTNAFEMECLGTRTGNNRTCCHEDDDYSSSHTAFNCTFEDKREMYTIYNSVCKSDDRLSTTVNITNMTDSTTASLKTAGKNPTTQKTIHYVTTSGQTKTTSDTVRQHQTQTTSYTPSDAPVISSTRESPSSTLQETHSTVRNTDKINTPAFSRGDQIPVAVAVSLTLIFLLVALVVFLRWKKGGKRLCTKSRRNIKRSQTSTLNPDGSALALRVNPTYDLDGRLADDVIHNVSLASVNEEPGSYAEITPREYESYRSDQHPATYTALQSFRSPGSDANDDDDPPVYTPIPVNDKPAKQHKADSDYVEPDTVLHHPGERAAGPASTLIGSSVTDHNEPRTDGKRRGNHRDVPLPNPKSSGYVDVDAPPIVFSETPAASEKSLKERQDQVDTGSPEGVYYFKLHGHSQDTTGEYNRELLDPSAADSGQYQSLEASATLPQDTKLTDECGGYDMINRNAINLAKTAANATSGNYNHVVIPAAAHSDGAYNVYDTVERPLLESALKGGDVHQQGAADGNIYNSTSLKGKTAAYDVIERPGMKHSINTTGDGDYSLAMPIV